MIIINIKTKFVLEGASYKYAGFLLGVHPNTVSRWGKCNNLREYKGWGLYYNTRMLQRGMFE